MPGKTRKITVKHYLNKRAKARLLGTEKYYPLYLQLIVSGHKAQLKSKAYEYFNTYRGYFEKLFPDKEKSELINQGYLSESLFKKISTEKVFPITTILSDEIDLITNIIQSILLFNTKSFSLYNFSSIYDQHVKDIHEILETSVKNYYFKELNDIFLKSTKSED